MCVWPIGISISGNMEIDETWPENPDDNGDRNYVES